MKKYIIKDSQGSKKTIYAENITHALSCVENLHSINKNKIKDARLKITFKNSDDFDEIDTIAKHLHLGLYETRNNQAVLEGARKNLEKYVDLVWGGDPSIKRLITEGGYSSEDSRVKDVDISFDKRIKKAVERGKLHDFAFNGLYAMKASKAEFPELKQELEKRNYKNIMFSNNPYNRYNVFFRDEASSVTTINALVNDEKAAIDSYNVAIKNLEGKFDEKAMQVLINIRNDERRHIENLYSILNGQVTEKNLEDSRMRDSKYYVGISTHGYTKEQAERDARKFGLQLKIVGKSRDPHFEYDAYFIGPRNNILKMLKANDLEEFEEDIEDSIHDSLDVEGYANYGLRIKNQLAYDLFYDGHTKGLDFNAVLKNYDSIAKQILAKIKEYLYDAKKTLISFKKY